MASQTTAKQEAILVDFLRDSYDCHTIILYGSRTEGRARPDSDWDVVAINDSQAPGWFNGTIDGLGEVNAFTYPEQHVTAHMEEVLNLKQFCFGLRHGRALLDKDGLGQRIIAEAQRTFETPEHVAPNFREHLIHFYSDTVLDTMDNPEKPSLVRHGRHHEVMVKSLFHYFNLRGKLRPPAKEALAFLQTERPEHYTAFANAAKRGATVEDVQAWLKIVLATD